MQYIYGLGDVTALPDTGVDAEQIARSMKASVDQLMPFLDDLISEGHLFTTTDETQYASSFTHLERPFDTTRAVYCRRVHRVPSDWLPGFRWK